VIVDIAHTKYILPPTLFYNIASSKVRRRTYKISKSGGILGTNWVGYRSLGSAANIIHEVWRLEGSSFSCGGKKLYTDLYLHFLGGFLPSEQGLEFYIPMNLSPTPRN
jgi:hypothetical protein